MSKKKPTSDELAAALETFARVWRMMRGLPPHLLPGAVAPLKDHLPGVWPTVGDCKRANDVLEAYGYDFDKH